MGSVYEWLKYRFSRKFCSSTNEKGQGLVEYALLLVLIAVVVIAAVTIVGQKANSLYNYVGCSLPIS